MSGMSSAMLRKYTCSCRNTELQPANFKLHEAGNEESMLRLIGFRRFRLALCGWSLFDSWSMDSSEAVLQPVCSAQRCCWRNYSCLKLLVSLVKVLETTAKGGLNCTWQVLPYLEYNTLQHNRCMVKQHVMMTNRRQVEYRGSACCCSLALTEHAENVCSEGTGEGRSWWVHIQPVCGANQFSAEGACMTSCSSPNRQRSVAQLSTAWLILNRCYPLRVHGDSDLVYGVLANGELNYPAWRHLG